MHSLVLTNKLIESVCISFFESAAYSAQKSFSGKTFKKFNTFEQIISPTAQIKYHYANENDH